jgi:hypothetical protein
MWKVLRNGIVPLLVVGVCAACGGSSSSGSPTTPTNHSPVLGSMSVTPSFVMSQLGSITASASATDADGDAMTYTWDFGDGSQATGSSVTKTYTGSGGNMTVRVTVTDGKGGSATDTRQVAVGSPMGPWTGTVNLATCGLGTKPMTWSLTQVGTTMTGSVTLAQGLCSYTPGTAVTDPAEPGTIDSSGKFSIRIKIPPYIDVYLKGQIDSTALKATGGLYGSGHNGTPFTMTKS